MDGYQYFCGNNTEKEKTKKWSVDLQAIVDECFTSVHNEYIPACNYIKTYSQNNRIESLL